MRITYCPRGHRLEITDTPHGWAVALPNTKEAWNGPPVTNCHYCSDLLDRRRPIKAKRTGES